MAIKLILVNRSVPAFVAGVSMKARIDFAVHMQYEPQLWDCRRRTLRVEVKARGTGSKDARRRVLTLDKDGRCLSPLRTRQQSETAGQGGARALLLFGSPCTGVEGETKLGFLGVVFKARCLGPRLLGSDGKRGRRTTF